MQQSLSRIRPVTHSVSQSVTESVRSQLSMKFYRYTSPTKVGQDMLGSIRVFQDISEYVRVCWVCYHRYVSHSVILSVCQYNLSVCLSIIMNMLRYYAKVFQDISEYVGYWIVWYQDIFKHLQLRVYVIVCPLPNISIISMLEVF